MAILFEELRTLLTEKLLILGGGKKYNQAVILAGGAGSGKGWVIRNLIGGDWKVHDPDELKTTLIRISKSIQSLPNDIGINLPTKAGHAKSADLFTHGFSRTKTVAQNVAALDLKRPEDVTKLHFLVKDLGLDDKQLFMSLAANVNSNTKPNILMDSTLKTERSANSAVSTLLQFGYKPEDIHIVWVLSDYKIAMAQNAKRDRRVFDDILIQTHLGAKMTMKDLVLTNYPKLGINGDLAVVFGGRGELVRPTGAGSGDGQGMLQMRKEFEGMELYIRLKKAGDRGLDEQGIKRVIQLADLLAPHEPPHEKPR